MKKNLPGISSKDVLYFILGIVLLMCGLYWILHSFTISSTWGRGYWSLFGHRMPLVVMPLPLIIGLVLAFFTKQKKFGLILSGIGVLLIVVSLITSIEFRLLNIKIYKIILMFGMTFTGLGMLIKVLFSGKKD